MAAILAGCVGLAPALASAEIAVMVPGSANIFGAGHDTAPDPGSYGPGTLPVRVDLFSAPTAREVTFDSITGEVSCLLRLGWWNGADGGSHATGNTDILSYGGISGIINQKATMFLVGVFTDGTEPSGPGPARLDVTHRMEDGEYSPLLFQTFFIGDGRSTRGLRAQQLFHVPTAATTLYLGFADAYGFGHPTDLPGSYNDNAGALDVRLTLVPSPGTVALLTAGSWLLLARRKR
ncbi:MAG: hypothetical protein IT435_16455 [Phycisphaerales bacterium]|nr:hypothetical protein [Phycisphaerales bacterium]